MRHIIGTQDFILDNTVVTIGKFDSLHRGHQLLFKTADELKSEGMQKVIFTFYNSPSDVLNHKIGKHILTRETRCRLAEIYGADVFLEFPFDDEIKNMSPEDFVKKILVDKLGIKAVVCGDDFSFGKDRSGDTNYLQELGLKYGFKTYILKKILYDGREISSTLIKSELSLGNLKAVNDMLGRTYELAGTVVEGNHIGKKIGFPTANLEISESHMILPGGVYITRAIVDGNDYAGVTNIGVKPTFDVEHRCTVETHLLGHNEELYGKTITIEFYKMIRKEQKFPSELELVKQIKQDIALSEDFFGENK